MNYYYVLLNQSKMCKYLSETCKYLYSINVLSIFIRPKMVYICAQPTPPQFSILDRSFPVPKGRMATAGGGDICKVSSSDNTHPTWNEIKEENSASKFKNKRDFNIRKEVRSMNGVSLTVPSPPQAMIRKFGTFLYSWSLNRTSKHENIYTAQG